MLVAPKQIPHSVLRGATVLPHGSPRRFVPLHGRRSPLRVLLMALRMPTSCAAADHPVKRRRRSGRMARCVFEWIGFPEPSLPSSFRERPTRKLRREHIGIRCQERLMSVFVLVEFAVLSLSEPRRKPAFSSPHRGRQANVPIGREQH